MQVISTLKLEFLDSDKFHDFFKASDKESISDKFKFGIQLGVKLNQIMIE